MFIAALFLIAKKGKNSTCPSNDKWINKMLHTPIMDIIWQEKESTNTGYNMDELWKPYAKKTASNKRPHITLLHLYEMLGIGNSIETESRIVAIP